MVMIISSIVLHVVSALGNSIDFTQKNEQKLRKKCKYAEKICNIVNFKSSDSWLDVHDGASPHINPYQI